MEASAPRHNADGTVAGVVCVVLQEAEALPARPPLDVPAAAAAAAADARLEGSGPEANDAMQAEARGGGGTMQRAGVTLTAVAPTVAASEDPRSRLGSDHAVSLMGDAGSGGRWARGGGAVEAQSGDAGSGGAASDTADGARGRGMQGPQRAGAVDVGEGDPAAAMAGSRSGFGGMGSWTRLGHAMQSRQWGHRWPVGPVGAPAFLHSKAP